VHLPVRRQAAGRRTRPVKRASFWISRTRLVAALLLVAVSGAFYWLTVTPQFTLADAKVSIDGAHFTDTGLVRDTIGLPEGSTPNLFRLRTQDMRTALEALPPVLSAEVSATLPDRLSIVLYERSPIFVWRTAAAPWLADVTGMLFAQPDPVDDPAEAALPVIADKRTDQPAIQAGTQLDALDLETARLLGALTPELLGSAAHTLALSVDDTDGWVLTADIGWRAVFGHYTPVLHTTAEIPAQVQCLRAMVVDREAQAAAFELAVGPSSCGTYLPLATPSSGRSPAPSHSTVP
jgi:cell division septal protein FtsQ